MISRIKSLVFITLFLLFYNIAPAQEMLYVQTSRTVFVSGEALLFKAWLVDAKTMKPTNSSSIIYFQLNGDNRQLASGYRINIENGTCNGALHLPDTLHSGYYYLTAFTNCMRNYNSSLCSTTKILVINQNDEYLDSISDFELINSSKFLSASDDFKNSEISIIPNKSVYKQREKVQLKIDWNEKLQTNERADLAISVSEDLSTDLAVPHNSITHYFRSVANEWAKYQAKASSESICKYPPEKQGFILKGKVVDKDTRIGIGGLFVLLTTPDSVAQLKYAATDSLGNFYFLVDRYYDNRDLVVQIREPQLYAPNGVIVLEKRIIDFGVTNSKLLSMDERERVFANNCRKIALVSKVYSDLNELNPYTPYAIPAKSQKHFYGYTDEWVYLADFVELENFAEIFRNIIFGVKFRKHTENYSLQVVDVEIRDYYGANAMVLLNNIPIFDYSVLAPLGSADIQKIEITRRRLLYGSLDLFGVISVTTHKPIKMESNGKTIVFKNRVMQNKSGFTTKLYDQSNLKSKTPDFRQTLYWNPVVILTDNSSVIEFYTSDLKAKYKVNIEGMTNTGKPISGVATFEVQ